MADATSKSVSAEQARADFAAARARLSGDVRELIDEVHPKRVVQRQVQDAKTVARTELEAARSQIKDENGWRWDRVALIGGAAAGLATLAVVVSLLTRKR